MSLWSSFHMVRFGFETVSVALNGRRMGEVGLLLKFLALRQPV